MSQIVTVFDPTTSQTTQFTAPNSSANGALVFFNESNVSVDLAFADGSTMYLPAWYHRHKCGATGSVNVQWDVHQVLSSLAPPISEIIVEAFAQGERFPADGPLVRQANVGNTVSTVGGSASSIQNDNNIAGTSIVEATVAGDNESAVSITNNGQAVFGSAINPGTLAVHGTSGTTGWLDTSGNFTVGTGNFIVANQVRAQNANDLGFHVNAGQRVVDTINNIDTFSVDSTGANLLAGTISLLVGSISRISVFTQLVTTILTPYNHGLGVKPDFVMMQLLGTSTATATGKYDDTSLTTTQVKMISSVNATYRVICVAL